MRQIFICVNRQSNLCRISTELLFITAEMRPAYKSYNVQHNSCNRKFEIIIVMCTNLRDSTCKILSFKNLFQGASNTTKLAGQRLGFYSTQQALFLRRVHVHVGGKTGEGESERNIWTAP